nr:SPFH domain-containing protein [Candidatus Sigynarchaeum springense]
MYSTGDAALVKFDHDQLRGHDYFVVNPGQIGLCIIHGTITAKAPPATYEIEKEDLKPGTFLYIFNTTVLRFSPCSFASIQTKDMFFVGVTLEGEGIGYCIRDPEKAFLTIGVNRLLSSSATTGIKDYKVDETRLGDNKIDETIKDEIDKYVRNVVRKYMKPYLSSLNLADINNLDVNTIKEKVFNDINRDLYEAGFELKSMGQLRANLTPEMKAALAAENIRKAEKEAALHVQEIEGIQLQGEINAKRASLAVERDDELIRKQTEASIAMQQEQQRIQAAMEQERLKHQATMERERLGIEKLVTLGNAGVLEKDLRGIAALTQAEGVKEMLSKSSGTGTDLSAFSVTPGVAGTTAASKVENPEIKKYKDMIDKLDERLALGEISEEKHTEMVAKFKQKIKELGG